MKKLYLIILCYGVINCYATNAKVTRIIDGDTFETETGEKVRLIGINAPEISDIFGQEAKQHLTNLIENKTIDLQSDNISDDRDRYSRLLRYVVLDGKDINKQMIEDGFAFAYLKYHFEKANEFKVAQLTASENKKGIWGNQNKDEVIKQQEQNEITKLPLSSKYYFVVSLVAILLIIGIYYYFKRS